MAQDIFEKIYNHPSLSKDDYRAIEAAHSRIEVAKNDILLQEGQTSNSYFLIEKGLFRSFVNDFDGNEITTEFFGVHEILIEVSSLFQRIPTQENLQALTAGICWKIEFETFQHLFHSIEGFPEWGRTWMSNQLFMAKQRAVNMLTQSATIRYLNLLSEQPQIVKQVPLKQIASYLGITDTSLSRIRKEILLKK
jgi:CRP-like cAMP-binding protein